MEEAGQRLDVALLVLRRLAEPELVEGCHRQPVEQTVGNDGGSLDEDRGGEVERRGPLARGQVLHAGVVASGQDRAPEGPPTCKAVDPGDRVLVEVVATFHARQDVVEVVGPLGVHPHARRLDRQHAHGGVEDDAGQAQPAGGGPEQPGVAVMSHGAPTGRRCEGERADVRREAPVAVVVLAVDIRRHRPAHGDEACPGGDGDEPPAGQEHLHQGVEADAGLDGDLTAREVGVADPVEAGGVDHQAAGALGGVAVAAPQPPGDQPPSWHGAHGVADLCGCRGTSHLGRRRRRAAPARQQLDGACVAGLRRHRRRGRR